MLARAIVPPDHRPLPRAALRRSWGTSRHARGPPMDRWDDPNPSRQP